MALNPDTGKLVWYFQASPHDTHDWDNVETPVLFDAEVNGHLRKLLAQAARNGYFFVLDRTNGEHILSEPFVPLNWSKGLDSRGQPIPDPKKRPIADGSLLTLAAVGATNWMPPSFSPDTELFYVNAIRGYSVSYLTDTDEKPAGYGGEGRTLWSQYVLEALSYKTGKVQWSHPYPTFSSTSGLSGPGILTTASKLLFSGDYSGNLIVYDAATGAILWHFGMVHSLANGPITFLLDGKQYVVVGAGDTLYAFTLAQQ